MDSSLCFFWYDDRNAYNNLKTNNIMKNENFWSGFAIGFFIGSIVGIIILNLVVIFAK